MKHILSFFITLILIITAVESHGFVKNRKIWWQYKIEKLKTEKEKLESNSKIYPVTVSIFEDEIKKSKEVIEIMQNSLSDTGSLYLKEKNYSSAEININLIRIYNNIFPILYLDFLMSNISRIDNRVYAKELLSQCVNSEIVSILKRDGKELTEKIILRNLTRWEWKTIPFELYFNRVISGESVIKKEILNDVKSKIELTFSEKGLKLNKLQLERKIIDEIVNSFNKDELYNQLPKNKNILKQTWTWNRFHSALSKKLKNYKNITEFLQRRGPVPYKELEYLLTHPSLFSLKIFNKLSGQHNFNKKYNKVCITGDLNSVDILQDKGIRSIVNDIDLERDSILIRLTGDSDRERLFNAEFSFNKKVNRYIKSRGKQFKKANLMMNENSNEEFSISDRKEFNEAEIIFLYKQNFLKNYSKRSLKFLEFVSSSRKKSSKDIVESFNYQLDRNSDYISYMRNIVRRASKNRMLNNKGLNNNFASSIRRTVNVFKFMRYSLSLDRKYLSLLSKKEIKDSNKKKSDLIKNISFTKYEIKSFYRIYLNNSNLKYHKKKNLDNNIREKIAQYEVDVFAKNIRRYIRKFKSMTYAEDAFTQYFIKYNKLFKYALNGEINKSLEDSLEKYSIIDTMNNFNAKKIEKEFYNKSYIKKRAEIEIAGLITLLKYYRYKKVDVREYPTIEEFNDYKFILNRRVTVKVFNWKMTEKNFHKIDRNAVKKLSIILNRKLKNSLVKKANQLSKKQEQGVEISEANIHLKIPAGWNSEKINDSEKSYGVLRNFVSRDKRLNIFIVKIPIKNRTIKELSEKWARKMGGKLIQKKWGKKNNSDFFWILSKDRMNNIVETYSIKRDGFVILISGNSGRRNYRFLKGTIRSVFKSMNF